MQKTESSKTTSLYLEKVWPLINSVFNLCLFSLCASQFVSEKQGAEKEKENKSKEKENSWPIKSTVKHHYTEVIGDKSTSETSVGCLTP